MADFINNDTLFILDSYGLIYREYFAFISRPLMTSKGQNVSAVFGFFRNLLTTIKTYNPKFMVAAMDSTVPTFRHEMYPEYKATRAKTPEDLHEQIPYIENILEVLGIPVIRKDGFEADDVIATLAKKCESEGRNCVILSADKDLQQLTNSHIHCMKPDKVKVWNELDEAGVLADWGVGPEKLLDLLSLMGDAADNVPGVKGVGQKTAVKLLGEYGTLEGIYEHADEIKGALGEKIRGDRENAFFSKKLITLDCDVPGLKDDDISKYCTEKLNFAGAAAEITRLEIRALARDLKELAAANGQKIVQNDSELGELFAGTQGGESLPLAPAEASATPSAGTSRNALSYSEDFDVSLAKKNEGSYKAVTDAKELAAFVEAAVASKLVAFDTETDSLNTREANLVGFSLAFEKGKGIYVPLIVADPLLNGPVMSKKDALDCLRVLFASDATVVMHNAKFDIQVLESNGLFKVENGKLRIENCDSGLYPLHLVDTMVAAWLLEPDRNGKAAYSLEYLAETKLGLKGTEYDEIVPKNGTFADVPMEIAANYGAEDSDFTLQLWQYFEPKLKEAKLWDLFTQMEMPVLPVLSQMEMTGIHLDSNYLKDYAVELSREIEKTEQEIYAAVGHEFNIASPKQLSVVLFEERKLPAGKKTKTGYSTDTSVLEELAAIDPVPKMILEYRGKAKLLSTYVETLPEQADGEGRVHTSFMQTGTATGRLSSKDPNLQNIPVRSEEGRRIRSAFTAAPGTVLISADYAQIELVVLAHLSGDKNLCEAFNNGTDVHKSTASLIYGISMDQVTAEQRRNAKTLNFGLMYGMGAFSLAKDLGINRTQAKEFIDSYFMVYSGVRNFFDENVRHAEEDGYIETIMGRRRHILAINSKNKMEKEGAIRIAKNSPIQGSAADIVKKAMLEVSKALEENPTGAKLLLQVHDELIFECPDNEEAITNTIALIKDKMEHAVKLNVPLRVSVEHGKAWGEFH
ncbi:MAG: DNA polymerase I [Treponema sp.]|nr:DNA polymerase I [Candidatus Treponema equifaecale]